MTTLEDVIDILKSRVSMYQETWIAFIDPTSTTKDEYFVQPRKYGFKEGPKQHLVLEVDVGVNGDPEVVFSVDAEDIASRRQDVDKTYHIGERVVIEKDDGSLITRVISELSSRQIKTDDGLKFKRSDGTGWGDNDSKILEDVSPSEIESDETVSLEDVSVGDKILLDTSEAEEVVDLSARQVITKNYKFKYNGEGWGGQSVNAIMIC